MRRSTGSGKRGLVRTRKHKGTKAQRHQEGRAINSLIAAFLVSLRLGAFVFPFEMRSLTLPHQLLEQSNRAWLALGAYGCKEHAFSPGDRRPSCSVFDIQSGALLDKVRDDFV